VGYYWRVKAYDNSGTIQATLPLQEERVAFKLDATDANACSISLSGIATSSITVSISGASDARSGLSATPYVVYKPNS